MTDAQIERYSRQILLPEVGARGQVRLLGARVALAGRGAAAATAAQLLGRAGVGVLALAGDVPPLGELGPDCRVEPWPEGTAVAPPDVAIDLGDGRVVAGCPAVLALRAERQLAVLALVGRPCAACLEPQWRAAGGRADEGLDPPTAAALGALVAGEALRLLLAPPAAGRATRLAPGSGTLSAAVLEPTGGCPACRARA